MENPIKTNTRLHFQQFKGIFSQENSLHLFVSLHVPSVTDKKNHPFIGWTVFPRNSSLCLHILTVKGLTCGLTILHSHISLCPLVSPRLPSFLSLSHYLLYSHFFPGSLICSLILGEKKTFNDGVRLKGV